MAHALGLCLKKLCGDFIRYGISYGIEAVDSKRMITNSFDGLINHLKDMMVGYEKEEVQELLKELEGVVTSIDWYMLEETVMGQMLKDVQSLVQEMWVREAWYNYEEIVENILIKLMANEVWYNHEETMMSYMQAKVKEMGVRKAWYMDGKTRLETILGICEELCNIRYNSNIEGEEVVVEFDDEVETLLDQLTGTCTKQFQIISIAGMAGLGKTTLAKILYSHPLVEYMFDIRAWICVSQVYLKKDLLLGILGSFIDDLTDEIYKMSDEQLGEKLYRLLKGRKYLVVFDDIWDGVAWNDLKIYFPNDKTGSRVLFTSRDMDVSLNVQSATPAHVLRLRTEDESWGIFQKKVFRTGICPFFLTEFGRVITKKCEGLPLAIVIAAGLLKKNWSNEWWKQIADSLSSFIVSDPSQYMDSLTLSYNHLPPHLRPCFLILGAFPEDYEIPVTKLVWVWIAHGFIHPTGHRTLEDVAEEYLMDLIKRCLVMTSRIRAGGQVKTCHIHDLLRDFSLRKAEEENFMPNIYRYGKVSSSLYRGHRV